jgi:hypothetical protein
LDCPLSPRTQELKDKNKNAKRQSPNFPLRQIGGKGIGQRVLSETFCYNRQADISRLVGNYKLIQRLHRQDVSQQQG